MRFRTNAPLCSAPLWFRVQVLVTRACVCRFSCNVRARSPHTKLSMVFLLSDGPSQMRVAGFESFVYDGAGCGCAFPSAAHHRSGESSTGTLKITFFFGDATPAAGLLLARKARGELEW